MLGDFVMIQAELDVDLDHCSNGGVIVQILSILLILNQSGFANELDVDSKRKSSKGDIRSFCKIEFYLEIEFHLG